MRAGTGARASGKRHRKASGTASRPAGRDGGQRRPSLDVGSGVVDIFEDDRRIADYDVHSASGAIALGAQLGRSGEARAGVLRGRARAHVGVGPSTLPRLDVSIGAWVGTLNFDRLDEAHFPHRGFAGGLGAFLARRGLGSDVAYDKLTGDASQFFTRGRNTVFMGLSGGTNLGSAIPFYDEFGLGGLFSLSGFREGEIRGQVYGVSRLGYYRTAGSLSGKKGRSIYLGAWTEAGNAWASAREAGFSSLRHTGTLGVGLDTFMGPLYLAYGRADGGHDAVYFAVDRSEDRAFSASTTSEDRG